jgi:hypothetical protein
VSFSTSKNTAVVNVLLPADKQGQVFKATISSPQKRKNTYNNTKTAVKVDDLRKC